MAISGSDPRISGEPRAPLSVRSEEHTSELQSRPHLVCRLLLEKKKKKKIHLQSPYYTAFYLYLLIPRPPSSTLFPYTTLFRSRPQKAHQKPTAPRRCRREPCKKYRLKIGWISWQSPGPTRASQASRARL